MKNNEGNVTVHKVLVVGCNGMLGADIMTLLKRDADFDAVGIDLPDIEITKQSSIKGVFKGVKPQVVVNCAAYTDVDGCENNRDLAFSVNGEGPGHLARAAGKIGASLIHISTDFVFDGTKLSLYVEEDIPNPISAYGESKLFGERSVIEQTDAFAIFRTAWLYGHHGRNFVGIIQSLAADKPEIRAVTDQMGSPTYSVHLAKGIIAGIKKNIRGLYHLTNSGCCTRYEWVRKILELSGLETKLLTAKAVDFPRPAARPSNSALDCSKFSQATGHEMPSWEKGLEAYFAA